MKVKRKHLVTSLIQSFLLFFINLAVGGELDGLPCSESKYSGTDFHFI